MSLRRIAPVGALLPTLCSLTACELTEVSLADPADVVVVEAYVVVSDTAFGDLARVFLHRTIGSGGGAAPVPGAVVRVIREDRGDTLVLEEALVAQCVASKPRSGGGTCYLSRGSPPTPEGQPTPLPLFVEGELLRLEVELPDGDRVLGATRVPGRFDLKGLPTSAGPCLLPPDTTLELVWSRAEGAWAYVSEAAVRGLPEALAARGVVFEDEELDLLGLSVSAADTTIVFPSELGVFARADLGREVAAVLQRGLPAGVSARISVAAVDRNWVNWLRGGNFNPSGQVRIPSVSGDATGWFGSAVVRVVDVATPGTESVGDGASPTGPGLRTSGSTAASSPACRPPPGSGPPPAR